MSVWAITRNLRKYVVLALGHDQGFSVQVFGPYKVTLFAKNPEFQRRHSPTVDAMAEIDEPSLP